MKASSLIVNFMKKSADRTMRGWRMAKTGLFITLVIGGSAPCFMVGFGGPLRPADVMDETGAAAATWLAKRAATAATIHSSAFAVWSVYDTNAYLQYKPNIDSLMELFDRAVPMVLRNFDVSVGLPVQVSIDSGDCCAGWAAMSSVGFRIGNFNSEAVFPDCNGFNAVDWTRGVIIGEFANHAAANGSSGCQPLDWWVDHVWYFPDMVVVNVLAEAVDPAAARKWERNFGCSDLMNVPLYAAFKKLLVQHGWQAYQNTFREIRNDSISFCSNFTNPSVLLTNYMLAYLSIGAGENVADLFRAAGASGADSATVDNILSARRSLRECPVQAGGNSAWQAFRAGNYQAVNICDVTGSKRSGIKVSNRETAPASGTVSVFDIAGRVIATYPFDRRADDRSAAILPVNYVRRMADKAGVCIVQISDGDRSVIRTLVVARQGD